MEQPYTRRGVAPAPGGVSHAHVVMQTARRQAGLQGVRRVRLPIDQQGACGVRRFVFYALLIGTLVFAAVLAGAFFVHALDVMQKASRLNAITIARFGNPVADIGIATGIIIAGLGVLLVCYRYANRLPFTARELVKRAQRDERRERRKSTRDTEPQNGE